MLLNCPWCSDLEVPQTPLGGCFVLLGGEGGETSLWDKGGYVDSHTTKPLSVFPLLALRQHSTDTLWWPSTGLPLLKLYNSNTETLSKHKNKNVFSVYSQVFISGQN